MTYIKTDIPAPGIVELLFYKGATGKALSNLANTLLLGPSPLTSGERETIAAYVSLLNNCEFCHESHSASVNAHLNDNGKTIACMRTDMSTMPVSDKMKHLLAIAALVQKNGKAVTPEAIEAARAAGASDEELHDTVLIAAAFCMFNRYVDGLNTNLPASKEEYGAMGVRMSKGYKYPPLFLRKFIIGIMKRQKSGVLRSIQSKLST
jgi:uncharacterized peroxidase-related enzyme